MRKASSRPSSEEIRISVSNTSEGEIIRIPSGVSYAAASNHLNRYGLKYRGAMRVIANILSYEYLWNEVRVKGGAYGCGCRINAGGNFDFYSYRDPMPLNSESVFDKSSDFLLDFLKNTESIDNFIISSIASTEPLESLRKQGLNADVDFLSGITSEDRLRYRNEMLGTTISELLELNTKIRTLTDESARCIVGNVAKPNALWKEMSL